MRHRNVIFIISAQNYNAGIHINSMKKIEFSRIKDFTLGLNKT